MRLISLVSTARIIGVSVYSSLSSSKLSDWRRSSSSVNESLLFSLSSTLKLSGRIVAVGQVQRELSAGAGGDEGIVGAVFVEQQSHAGVAAFAQLLAGEQAEHAVVGGEVDQVDLFAVAELEGFGAAAAVVNSNPRT